MAGTHFPRTTPSQRRLLFETWQATRNVTHACQVAHVGQRTFYYWKPRFLAGGYAALEQFASPVAHHLHRTAPAVVAEVIALRQEQPGWGKRRLAAELAKGQGWMPLVSPSTVQRILRAAGLLLALAVPTKRGGQAARTGLRTSPAKPST
jgi:hypothetical protein